MDPQAVLSSIASWLLKIAQSVGIIIVIWGAVQFFLSLRDQNPDGQQRAIWTLVAGVALAALGTVLSGFGIAI